MSYVQAGLHEFQTQAESVLTPDSFLKFWSSGNRITRCMPLAPTVAVGTYVRSTAPPQAPDVTMDANFHPDEIGACVNTPFLQWNNDTYEFGRYGTNFGTGDKRTGPRIFNRRLQVAGSIRVGYQQQLSDFSYPSLFFPLNLTVWVCRTLGQNDPFLTHLPFDPWGVGKNWYPEALESQISQIISTPYTCPPSYSSQYYKNTQLLHRSVIPLVPDLQSQVRFDPAYNVTIPEHIHHVPNYYITSDLGGSEVINHDIVEAEYTYTVPARTGVDFKYAPYTIPFEFDVELGFHTTFTRDPNFVANEGRTTHSYITDNAICVYVTADRMLNTGIVIGASRSANELGPQVTIGTTLVYSDS